MTEPADPKPPSASDLKDQLAELAQRIRGATHLQADAQQELSDLLAELSRSLGDKPSAQTSELAASAAHVARALHEQHHAGLVATAKRKLEEAAVSAETQAPVTTGVALRLIDLLGELGI